MMELLVLLYSFGLLFGASSSKLDETSSKCAESCLNIFNTTSSSTIRHCTRLTADNKCECDWEKVLTPEGTCECLNPRHKIDPATNACVCDMGQCKKKGHCVGIMRKDPHGCCPLQCEECPEDSYPESDNKCSCYPCKQNTCKDNQTAVVLIKGKKQPGHCCDLYKCEDLNRNCETSSGNYTNGATWISNRTCEKCICENGIMFCDQLNEECVKKNESSTCLGLDVEGGKYKVYQNDESWMRDSCTKCICENGQTRCFPHFCEDVASVTIRPVNQDCPPLTSCKRTCVFGYKLSRKGCETCKCKMPDTKWIAEMMKMYNCTLENCDLKKLTTSNCSQNTSGGVEQQKATEYYSHIPYICALVFLSALCLVLGGLLCRARRRGDLHISQLAVVPGARPQYVTVPVFADHPAKIRPAVEMKNFH